MANLIAFSMVAIVTLFFGLIVGFQLAHIRYVHRLIALTKRSINTGTLFPLLAELKKEQELQSSK